MYYYPVRKNLNTGKEWIDYSGMAETPQQAKEKSVKVDSFMGIFGKLHPVLRISKCELIETEVVEIL